MIGANGKDVSKRRDEYTPQEKEKVQLNFKAINILLCSLNLVEFNLIINYETAKQIWEKHKVIYESASQVNDTRINLFKRAMVATWLDSETFSLESGSEEIEVKANLCLMPKEAELSDAEVSSNSICISENDLQNSYDSLYTECLQSPIRGANVQTSNVYKNQKIKKRSHHQPLITMWLGTEKRFSSF
ncbi:hypothetical protein PTKIN_Ptkin01aG0143500 [Pterospermum kingtungense]